MINNKFPTRQKHFLAHVYFLFSDNNSYDHIFTSHDSIIWKWNVIKAHSPSEVADIATDRHPSSRLMWRTRVARNIHKVNSSNVNIALSLFAEISISFRLTSIISGENCRHGERCGNYVIADFVIAVVTTRQIAISWGGGGGMQFQKSIKNPSEMKYFHLVRGLSPKSRLHGIAQDRCQLHLA